MKTDREIELEEENKRLRTRLAWIDYLMCNVTAEPKVKVVLYKTERELAVSQKDEIGLAHIRLWKVAKEIGVSTDVVGKVLKFLADNGVIRRAVRPVQNEVTGFTEKGIFVSLTDVARNPSRIELPKSGHGGRRTPLCESCGNDSFVEKVQRICTRCGTVHESWRTIEPKPEGEDNA